MYQRQMLTVLRTVHYLAGNDFHVVKLMFVEFHLRHRHGLHDKQGECETYLEL